MRGVHRAEYPGRAPPLDKKASCFERCAGRERRGARARAQGGTWAIWRESESMTVPHTSALISLEVNMLSNMR
jgi:hypothetical protein